MLDTVLNTVLIADEITKLRYQFSKKLMLIIRMMKNEENGYFYPFSDQNKVTLQTHHVDSTLKRRGNDRFHVV